MLTVFKLWPKNDFFIMFIKKDNFARNVDTVRVMAKKRFFIVMTKMAKQQNVDSFRDMPKTQFFYSDLKKWFFTRNCDSFRDMAK